MEKNLLGVSTIDVSKLFHHLLHHFQLVECWHGLLFLANAEGVGAFNLSRILGRALAALVEHPVESLLSNVFSDEDG